MSQGRDSISVIIPCHERPRELRRAIESVAGQSRLPDEVIVCDDGSREDMGAVTDAYRHLLPITCLRIANSGGPARPRNVAVAYANARWIAFLDSDDSWYPRKLEAVTELLDRNDIYYHRMRTVGDGDRRWHHRKVVGSRPPSKSAVYDLLSLGNPVPTSGAIVRRELYRELGGMDELSMIEDYEFWVRAAAAGARFAFVPKVLGTYEISETSRSARYEMTIASIERLFSEFGCEFRGSKKRAVDSYMYYFIGVQFARAGRRAEAVEYFWRASALRTMRQRIGRALRLAKLRYCAAGLLAY